MSLLRVVPLAALVAGCSAFEPETSLPANAQLLTAPAEFAAWHARTEACSGLRGNFGAIEWYVVPGVDAFETSEGPKVGLWSKVGDRERIVVAGNLQRNEMVIRHEILHSLLGRQGHPSEYFVTRCGLTWESWTDAG